MAVMATVAATLILPFRFVLVVATAAMAVTVTIRATVAMDTGGLIGAIMVTVIIAAILLARIIWQTAK